MIENNSILHTDNALWNSNRQDQLDVQKEIEARPHYYINYTTSTTHEEYVTERVRDDVKIPS